MNVNSENTQCFHRAEKQELMLRLERNKIRVSELIDQLSSGDLLEHSPLWDALLDEFKALSMRIDQDETRLAIIKMPSELTPDDRKKRPSQKDWNARNKVNY